MHRFYAPPSLIRSREIVLDLAETRHLREVLRLRVGQQINVFDGKGREFACKVEAILKNQTLLSVVKKTLPTSPESTLNLTLAVAMLKGEKFDTVIQKAVELGVTTLVPLRTVRCDVRSKESLKRLDRWRKIALEASKQTGRATLMQVKEPVSFENYIRKVDGKTLLFSERAGNPFPVAIAPKTLTAIIGSEGGWDDTEIDAASANGVDIVTLGGRILRAETAAIVVAAILQHRFGDLN